MIKINSKLTETNNRPHLQDKTSDSLGTLPSVLTSLFQNKVTAENNFSLKERQDPLHISRAQYVIALFNVLAIATDYISPKATIALTVGSILAEVACRPKVEIKDQMLFLGGEACSLVLSNWLNKVPLLKTGFDLSRIATIALPCLDKIRKSFWQLREQPARAIKCGVINGLIVGTSVYRIRDSIHHAFSVISQLSKVFAKYCRAEA